MNCSVCGSEIGAVKVGGLTSYVEFAVIGTEEHLCVGKEDSCFGWFSGYPWVLFEMGNLVSDLREPQPYSQLCMYSTIYDPPYNIAGKCVCHA